MVVSALQERLNALTKLKTTLNVGAVPQSWDAGAYLPFGPINDTLDRLTDLSLKSSNLIPGEDLELRVVRFVLGASNAVASAAIEVEVSSPSRKLSIALQGNAQVSFRGVTAGEKRAHGTLISLSISPICRRR